MAIDMQTIKDSRSYYMGGRFHLGGRNRLWPAPYLNVAYTRLHVGYDVIDYRKSDYGIEAGLIFETKFNRISYGYNTCFDGYHHFDYLAAFSASQRGKIGTRYSFYHGKNYRMFQIRLYAEGATGIDKDLNFYGKGSLIHSILAGGIFSPIILIVEIIRLLEK